MISKAIRSINPNAVFIVGRNSLDEITWLEGTKPIDKPTIEAKITELQAEYDSKQYQRDRAEQYPSIQDVVVALAEKEEGDDTMWQHITALRQKIKADNPKPQN